MHQTLPLLLKLQQIPLQKNNIKLNLTLKPEPSSGFFVPKKLGTFATPSVTDQNVA